MGESAITLEVARKIKRRLVYEPSASLSEANVIAVLSAALASGALVPAEEHARVCAELERLRRAYRATIPLDQVQMQRVVDAVGGAL